MSAYSGEIVLKENLRALRLPTILREYGGYSRAAIEHQSSYIDFLSHLTTLEVNERNTNRIKRRISEAQFPALKTLESFQMNKAPALSAHLVRELSGCGYIERGENVILIGKSGTGKTHFSTGLGIEACRKSFKVRFYTACQLVTELVEARDEYRLKQLTERLKKYDLLVLDELGYVPFRKTGAELLFQVLADRYEHHSTIITTNLPFPQWVEVFGAATLTGALLDRITHHCHILEFNWASVRFWESTASRQESPQKYVSKTKPASKEEKKPKPDKETDENQ